MQKKKCKQKVAGSNPVWALDYTRFAMMNKCLSKLIIKLKSCADISLAPMLLECKYNYLCYIDFCFKTQFIH